jgi:hypothetical protein
MLAEYRRRGVWRLYRQDRGSAGGEDSVVLEHVSDRLRDALAAADTVESIYDVPEEVGLAIATRRHGETVAALHRESPRLAEALARNPSRIGDLDVVAHALRDTAPTSASDLLRWAAHLWLARLAVPVADTATARRVRAAFRGAAYFAVPEEEDLAWCWDDPFVDALAARAGANRWTDLAFLERTEAGWQRPCTVCGFDADVGGDQWRRVIAHGEAYLARHPNSTIAHDVRWAVAEAYETAWSLAHAAPGDEYIDASAYGRDAARYRARAIALYESLLPGEPAGPRRDAAVRRLRRIRIDADTDHHPYWCVWD